MLLAKPSLRDAGEALIAAANEAGGRDNITVVLLRLEDVHAGEPPLDEHATLVGAPSVAAPVGRRSPRRPPGGGRESEPAARARRRRRARRAGAAVIVLVLLGLLASAGYIAQQSVYFIGTNSRGLVTLFRGVPYRLAGNIDLYSSDYVSGVSASTLTPERRRALLDHSLRSEANARLVDTQPRTRTARMRPRAMNRPIIRLFGLVVAAVRAARRVHLALDGLRSLLAARQPAQRAPAARAAAHRPRADRRRRRHRARAQRAQPPKASTNAPTRPAKSSRTRSATPTPTSAAPGSSASATPPERPDATNLQTILDQLQGKKPQGEKVITTLDPRAQRVANAALGEARKARWSRSTRAPAPSR